MATKHAPKYLCDGNSLEDVIQQGVTEGLMAIANGKYRPEQHPGKTAESNSPEVQLMRFMSVHIRNRLSNFQRDTNRRALGLMTIEEDCAPGQEETPNKGAETIEIIKAGLSERPELLNDFYRFADGCVLSSSRKRALFEAIREIVKGAENGQTEEEDTD